MQSLFSFLRSRMAPTTIMNLNYLGSCVSLFIVISLIKSSDAAKILAYFPVPSISHQVVFRPLTQELAKRGHEVLVFTPDPAFPKGGAPENLTEIDFNEKSYDMWREIFVKHVDGDGDSAFKIVQLAFRCLIDVYEMQLKTKEMQDLIKSDRHFDLILTEALSRPALILSHVFKSPVIQVSSFGTVPPNNQVFGSPSHPVLYPELNRKRIHNLSIWEKIEGAYEDFRFRHLQWSMEDPENTMLKRIFSPNIPSVSELSENVDMLFLNIYPIWDNNRPVPPGVIYMGGMHQKPQKELPSDLKSFFENSKHGVIYMSFGTNVSPSQLPVEKIKIFNKVFSQLPYDVLWKWDKDTMPGKAKNVKLSKWLPQSDLLRHPKLKLFITQAGLQSTDEAITASVPLIAFPMLGDQWYNAEKYVHFGIGLKLDIQTITEDVLMDSIQNVIGDDSYGRNIAKLRDLMQDEPHRPLERAVWWAEYVIRHGGAKHLRSPAANISWTEYLMLDVVFTILGLMLLVFTVILRLFRLIFGKNFKIKQH